MTATFWSDLRCLILSLRFAIGTPRILGRLRRDAAGFMTTYDEVVLPIVHEHVRDIAKQERLADSLRSYTVKACFVVKAYACMANVSFLPGLAVLGLSFGRLYDDLLDECGSPDLEARLSQLFQYGTFMPVNDLEIVLYQFYRSIEALLQRNPDDPIFKAVMAVHEYQILSRKQRETVTRETLFEITRGKGGNAVVTLFALMRESMSSEEVDLLLQFGEAAQILDDYQDIEFDLQNGVHTLITEGICGLHDIRVILQRLHPELCMFYGRRRTESFLTVFYLTMWISFLRRHWPTLGTSHPRGRAVRPSSAVKVLLVPGDNLVQEARTRVRRTERSQADPAR